MPSTIICWFARRSAGAVQQLVARDQAGARRRRPAGCRTARARASRASRRRRRLMPRRICAARAVSPRASATSASSRALLARCRRPQSGGASFAIAASAASTLAASSHSRAAREPERVDRGRQRGARGGLVALGGGRVVALARMPRGALGRGVGTAEPRRGRSSGRRRAATARAAMAAILAIRSFACIGSGPWRGSSDRPRSSRLRSEEHYSGPGAGRALRRRDADRQPRRHFCACARDSRGRSAVAAEDTRHSGRLLRELGLERPLVSLHEHNERARVAGARRRACRRGESIALVSRRRHAARQRPGLPARRAPRWRPASPSRRCRDPAPRSPRFRLRACPATASASRVSCPRAPRRAGARLAELARGNAHARPLRGAASHRRVPCGSRRRPAARAAAPASRAS